MTKAELLAALRDSRAALLEAIEGLSDGELAQPGVVGRWSVKDLVNHLAAWEAELVTLLAGARHGQRPRYADLTPAQTDELNARWYGQARSRPLDRVLADFHGVRRQTLRQLESLTEADLNDPGRYSWLRGRPLWEWIAGDSFQHEAEHAAQIQAWRQTRPKPPG